ncbi:hypothetical protein C5167_020575 [Papaver somniferum]|uniref:glutathione gamma-glutamylcysteinyltransferase n=1 Tax=Papaver somniferum TaxID=3469 RepID=A0A4Y7IXE4_PAPSO|nr:hypothetical protein C5167_020575 [Papaver somniferum]
MALVSRSLTTAYLTLQRKLKSTAYPTTLYPPPRTSQRQSVVREKKKNNLYFENNNRREQTRNIEVRANKNSATMAMAGLYRRVLPSPPAIEFASTEGKELFSEALQSGNMEGFFKLISYFQTQSEPAYCGLASISMVLNALAIDPRRKWKGPWRWFDESMLDCCEPLEKVKAEGITFSKVVCLAHCAGAEVKAFRTNKSSIDDFRKYLMTCTSSEDSHLVTSYHRGPLKQTGTGHFSPIGGYHAARDLALILDTARFKYPPHWVPVTLLWEAMNTIDEATGHHRGYELLSDVHAYLKAFEDTIFALYLGISCKNGSWNDTAKYLMGDVHDLLQSADVRDVQKVLSVVVTSLPAKFTEFIKWVAEVRRQEDAGSSLSEEEKERLAIKEEVLKQVRETELFKHVVESPCCRSIPSWNDKDTLPEIAAMVCSQGAEILSGKFGSSNGFCCKDTCVSLTTNGDTPITMVCGTVVTGKSQQGVDMLVPYSEANPCGCHVSGPCKSNTMHPVCSDILTALLLALPPHTWSGPELAGPAAFPEDMPR